MFLKSVTELPVDFECVRAAMQRNAREWLEGPASEAGRYGRRLLAEVGLENAPCQGDRSAGLELGTPVTTDRVVSFPLRFDVQEAGGLIPSLGGTFDAAWLGSAHTQLALSGSYDPPLSVLDRMVDRTLLHRVAETVAHHFLHEVAERLTP